MIGNFLRKSEPNKPQETKIIPPSPPDPFGSPPPTTVPLEKSLQEKEKQKEQEKIIETKKTLTSNEPKKDFREAQVAEKLFNVLATGTKFSGSIAFQNQLVVNGHFEGQIYSNEGTLIIGEKAVVHAQVEVGNVLISGRFSGNIYASDLTELRNGSEVFGDVKTRRLKVEEGSILNGKCECTAKSIRDT
ncbi:polymer-forming cytoskeletal protein [Candidatus Methylacidiphilum fumarolicum]|uniref:Integral membrane protein CcmA involved in cell shape determination n=2 Tax=Candidatus Methylacidiphilum fumarolicum TaxID=591154 RepID=I0JWM2_METFB|nr:polymer-forming cytoskeletal protein [Candidatus Methylacidiphilum fumarolicum]MBW6414334.1 polymer-forming cytoskeletal protein [Candidatus Methylacidiphilum fumarolicum]TFE65830.1 cell shape determination protein CcmA [Candidatus Methylacidiphilum fumarolicum]TFE71197.1 polymer-forming cytoskeletal protein [Candidatus Methylacidiphilum fumarolicum]TFE71648.1 polymer-forming cytoskeletal protein [Candidatus Methylacidiphilum fumarolicum]TFE76882.1 cell shape determination protein CcmA [Can